MKPHTLLFCLVLACGSKNGPTTNLKPVFFRTMAPGGNVTSMTVTTELFNARYRAVFTATPVTATDDIEPFETQVFTAAGGGAVEPQTIARASGGNLVSLHFMENGAPVADTQIGGVSVWDANTLIPIASGSSTNGVAAVGTGTMTNVIAIVEAPNGATLAAVAYTGPS